MPGLNQRGPENMGPMTGRKMGRCVTGDNQYQSYGSGLGNGRGRGCGRGFGPRGRGGASWPVPADPRAGAAPDATKESLSLRAQALEQELEAVRSELKNL